MADKLTVETVVNAPLAKVWECSTRPEHIMQWCFAQDDWEVTGAENDLRVGGRFRIGMAAKDKSGGFDWTGTYSDVREHELFEYDMGDEHNVNDGLSRHVKTLFESTPDGGTRITQTFDPENTYPLEEQRKGWQAILDNLKKYAESA